MYVDTEVGELRHAIETLSTSEILKESEIAVLWIKRLWQEANMQAEIQSMLSEPQIINGLVDIFFNFVDAQVLRATVFLLFELGSRDDSVIQTLSGVDPDVECVVALFKKGLLEAVILGSAEEISISGAFGSFLSDEERFAAVTILLRCIHEDGNRRNLIAQKITSIIKDECTFSTIHTLLIYLQTALHDQRPAVAGLLMQLDILLKPRKASIYREEALDTIISCLKNSEFPAAQIAAAETILVLHGRFSYYGKPLARAFLLNCAGPDKTYKYMMIKDHVMITSQNSGETMVNFYYFGIWYLLKILPTRSFLLVLLLSNQ